MAFPALNFCLRFKVSRWKDDCDWIFPPGKLLPPTVSPCVPSVGVTPRAGCPQRTQSSGNEASLSPGSSSKVRSGLVQVRGQGSCPCAP